MYSHAAENERAVIKPKSSILLLDMKRSFAPHSPWCTIGTISVIQQGALDASLLHDALQVACRHDRAELTPRPLAGCPADTAHNKVAEPVLGCGQLHRHRRYA